MIAVRSAAGSVVAKRHRKHIHKHVHKRVSESSDSSNESDESEDQGSRTYKKIKALTVSNMFSLVVAGAIMLNVCVMACQANFPDFYLPWSCSQELSARRSQLVEDEIAKKKAGAPTPHFSVETTVRLEALDQGCQPMWFLFDNVFLVFFTVEIVLRLITFGTKFFTDEEDRVWNIFDFSVVLGCLLNTASRYVFEGHRSSQLITMIRVVRILRILRVVRLFKQLSRLRMLVRGLLESMNVVLWIVLLLSLVIMIYAIFCTDLIGHQAHTFEDPDKIRMYFGSIANSTATLFQFLTLDDWSTITRMVAYKQPIMWPMFLMYVVGVALVVVSLLTGVMAEHMNAVRESEETLEEHEKHAQLGSAVFLTAFQQANTQGDVVDRTQFATILEEPSVVAEFKKLDFDTQDFSASELFDLCDKDCDEFLTWEEFKEGLEEVHQPVGPKEVFKLQAVMQQVANRTEKVETALSSRSEGGKAKVAKTMTKSVELSMDKVVEAMNTIEETINTFEDELEEFVAGLRNPTQDDADQ